MRGRNHVVDPCHVQHGEQAPHRFVAERVYANNPGRDKRMEAGWVEIWDYTDEQCVCELDSAAAQRRVFTQYSLSEGESVETAVQYLPGVGE